MSAHRSRFLGGLNSAELDAGDFKVNYLVDQVLVAGQPGVVAGPKKSLKTNVCIDLTLSLASGKPFLGEFSVPHPVRVALVSGESGRGTIQETARRIAASKGLDLSGVRLASWHFEMPAIGDAGSDEQLKRFVRDGRVRVLIIDPAYLALRAGDDANNLFKMGERLSVLSALAQETNCTPLLVPHFRKNVKRGANPDLDHIAWAGIPEWTRQWVLLNRLAAYDPKRAGCHKLSIAVGGSAGHSGSWGLEIDEGSPADVAGRIWRVQVTGRSDHLTYTRDAAASSLSTQQKIDRDWDRIKDLLKSRLDGDTVSCLGAEAGMNSLRYKAAIAEGRSRGLIVDCRVIKNGARRDGVKLKSDDSDDHSKVGEVGVVGLKSDERSDEALPLGEPSDRRTVTSPQAQVAAI